MCPYRWVHFCSFNKVFFSGEHYSLHLSFFWAWELDILCGQLYQVMWFWSCVLWLLWLIAYTSLIRSRVFSGSWCLPNWPLWWGLVSGGDHLPTRGGCKIVSFYLEHTFIEEAWFYTARIHVFLHHFSSRKVTPLSDHFLLYGTALL